MAKKPFIILAGEPGLWKSSEAQVAFQRNWTVKTGEDVLHYYEHEIVPNNPNCVMPVKQTLIDEYGVNGQYQYDASGMPIPIKISTTIESMLTAALRAGSLAKEKGEPPPFEHVVIDEIGELFDWLFEELARSARTADGGTDTRKAYGKLNTWTGKFSDMCKRLKTVNIGVCMVGHNSDPDPESRRVGGIKLPSNPSAKKLTAKADGLLMRRVLDKDDPEDIAAPKRAHVFWECRPSQFQAAKMRGLKPADVERIEDMSLQEIITVAGWDLSST